MITKEEIDQFYQDVDRLGLKFPNASIKKATGYSSGNVSDILKKKRDPSEDFLKAFYKKFPKSSTNVPQNTVPTGNMNTEGGKSDLAQMIENNKILTLALDKAQDNIKSAQDTLSKCQEDQRELIQLLKANSNPAARELSEALVTETIVDWLLKIGVKVGVFPTVESGRKEIGKTLSAHAARRKAVHNDAG